jgi:Putative MetA-pathway of phenol degradation
MRAAFPLFAFVLVAAPALADHMGPTSLGGGLIVSGPDTLDAGHAAVGARLIYTRPKHRSDQELESLSSAGIAGHNTDYNLNASISGAYGITHELTISAELPYVRRDDLRAAEDGEVERLGSVSGIGDMSLLAKYRLTDGENTGFALIGGIKMPTGSTRKHDLAGNRLETEHQPGTGSWDPILGASASTKAGGLRISASALYQISGKGTQHTQLGDRLQGGIALSHRFGPAEHEHLESSHNHHHGDEVDEHHDRPESSWDAFVEIAGEWEGRQTIAGEVERASGGKTLWLAPGARFNSAAGWSVGASLGVPVYQRIRLSHPENDYRFSVAVGHSL